MKINFYEETVLGGRQNNQDYFAHILQDNYCCFIIADGLGGHQGGEIASKEFCIAVIEMIPTFAQNIQNDPSNGMQELILSAWKLMRNRVIEKYTFSPQTTFALLWLDERQLITAHVGDSRIYRLLPKMIMWRTPDHTMVQQLFEQGQVDEDEIGTHPLQNRLLRAVSIEESPETDIYVQPPLPPEESILLCTDGFWGPLKQAEILQIANSEDSEKTIHELIAKILLTAQTSADNITIQYVKYE
jgi:protein phosphatase